MCGHGLAKAYLNKIGIVNFVAHDCLEKGFALSLDCGNRELYGLNSGHSLGLI